MISARRFHAVPSLLFAGLLAAAPSDLDGQSVTGRAIDAADGSPVAGAEVVLVDDSGRGLRTAVTDSAGVFGLPVLNEGIYTLRIRHLGYSTVTSPRLELGAGMVEVELRMGREAIALDSLIVLARDESLADHSPEYHRRLVRHRRTGVGDILSREELEPLTNHTVREALDLNLFRFRNQGIPCTPMIFWNGLAVSSWEVPVRDVEGIEVYRGANEVPIRYTRYRQAVDCGVVLVWSRVQRPDEGTTNSAKAFLSGVGAFVLFTLLVP